MEEISKPQITTETVQMIYNAEEVGHQGNEDMQFQNFWGFLDDENDPNYHNYMALIDENW